MAASQQAALLAQQDASENRGGGYQGFKPTHFKAPPSFTDNLPKEMVALMVAQASGNPNAGAALVAQHKQREYEEQWRRYHEQQWAEYYKRLSEQQYEEEE